ncbi:MAG TPA: RES family NAD+ phosphorylase [Opitutaceae bacterium]|nr:RES family NAD+ phosphorylase [Opitutaceae bacterium]
MSEVIVWRLCRQCYAEESYSGEGSRRFGGRWSSPGRKVAYSSESRSLAALEVLVNVRDPSILFREPWTLIAAKIPADLIERPVRVPENWQATPYPPETQVFGDNWMEASLSAVLRVPSVVVLGEFNYLLNPAHADFKKIAISKPEPFLFDSRFKL